MKTLGKIIFGVLITLLIIISIALYFAWSNLDSIAAGAIEKYGSQAIGTPVTVGKVEILLEKGTAQINNLTIGNPQGYQSDHVMEIGTIQAGLDISSLKTNTIVVNEIVIDGAGINAEIKGTQSNLTQIRDNLKQQASSAEPSAQPAETETETTTEQKPAAPGKKFIVKAFRFTNGQATALIDAVNIKQAIKIPDISLQDIGAKSGGVAGSELAQQILQPVIEKVMEQVRNQTGKQAIDTLKETGKKALENLLK
ncbi:hypothetical conserved protein [Candidatus Nitrosoglobus terrae]|uniref:Hypothetical conserved protein n=1 Tax=Candidatus Nitrosoglobus terrae TaxID=1630141 RepID=A0A1Q2SNA7_9GAMM|nr:AsmA family protein [Candidatus Nitrosoglobus terrae]BAW80628.1 hypothetical conserved protein [Candidatus Nitrosoglobus terrae]